MEKDRDKKRIAKHEDIYKKMTNSPDNYEKIDNIESAPE